MQKVEVLGQEEVYSGFNKVVRVHLREQSPDGEWREAVTREVVERGDAVGVLIRVTERDAFLFVRQLRAPLIRHGEPHLAEIVAGTIDEGETPEEAATREIEEEVGYRVNDLRPLGEMYGSPGGLSEKLFLFYAEVSDADRTGEGGGTDPGEDVEIVYMPREEAVDTLERGDFRDAKTQLALLWWLRKD